jgi:CHRD domain
MNKRVGIGIVAAAAALAATAVAVVPGIASGGSGTKADLHPDVLGQGLQLVAHLTSASEFPPPSTLSKGTGTAIITIDPNTNQICWNIAVSGLEEAPILAHIHEGAFNVAGPVRVNLFPPLPPQNGTSTGCVTDATFAPLIAANPAGFYVNVHTLPSWPAGAIRGQLAASPQATVFLPVPARAYDSRTAGGKLEAGETRIIPLATGKDSNGTLLPAVPAGATAAIVNLTITDTEGAGFVKMYSAAIPEPATSSINWSESNQNLAVSTPVGVDATANVKITGGVNATNVVIDVIGYTF